jgi:DoxX.
MQALGSRKDFMFTPLVFWPWFAGLIFLAAGVILRVASRRAEPNQFFGASGWDKLIAFGPVFVASPLAVFAAEHFVGPRLMEQMVPPWMPVRIFWVYFVGLALIAAAASLTAMKFVRFSGTLLGVLFFIFVLTIYLPFAFKHPTNRLGLNFVLRESSFAGGAWALAGSQRRGTQTGKTVWMILVGRLYLGAALFYFGLEQVLHPEFAPGVPDTKLTPAWVPMHALWGYPFGVSFLVAGAALLLNKRARVAAIGTAVLMLMIALFLHLPILAMTRDPSQMTDGINFVADTILYAGTALLVARALPASPLKEQSALRSGHQVEDR